MAKETKSTSEKNKEVAQEYAQSKGYKNINELNDKVRSMMNSENAATRAVGERIAQETVQDLLLLCLRQEIINTSLPNYMNLTDRVFDGYMKEGNQKEYVAHLDTGKATLASNEPFVPDAQTIKKLEKYILQVYTAAGQLNPKAYQFKKEMTIPLGEWIPFFKSGKLNEYVSQLQSSLNRVYQMFTYDKLARIIAQDGGKIIQGTATNLFDAWLEILPHIDKMQQYNSDYNNEQTSKQMYAANPEDLLIFTSTKVRSLTKNGIKSQMFNAELLGASSKTLNDENLKFLGNALTIGDQNTIISNQSTEYIPDTTIIVLDISRIKHIIQLDQAGTQFFQKNITEYLSKNVWGVMDILPWCKKLVYKNNNLLTVPTQVSE